MNKRIVLGAIAALAALTVPMSYVHEYGHALICAAEGLRYEVTVNVLGAGTYCDGDMQNLFLYHLFGGLLAAMVAGAGTVLTWKKFRYVGIALLALTTGHGINAIVEGFIFDWYMNYGFVIIVPNMIALFIYMKMFARKPKPIPISKEQSV